jgi:hypothetical protein
MTDDRIPNEIVAELEAIAVPAPGEFFFRDLLIAATDDAVHRRSGAIDGSIARWFLRLQHVGRQWRLRRRCAVIDAVPLIDSGIFTTPSARAVDVDDRLDRTSAFLLLVSFLWRASRERRLTPAATPPRSTRAWPLVLNFAMRADIVIWRSAADKAEVKDEPLRDPHLHHALYLVPPRATGHRMADNVYDIVDQLDIEEAEEDDLAG